MTLTGAYLCGNHSNVFPWGHFRSVSEIDFHCLESTTYKISCSK
jgi:hypothetical protein